MKLVEVNAVNTGLSKDFDFGIHAASCADLKRGENRWATQYTHEVESPQALIEGLIEDLAGDFGEDAESFAFRVFPCCDS